MIDAYGLHTEMTWLTAFGADSSMPKRLFTADREFLDCLVRKPQHDGKPKRRRCIQNQVANMYPAGFCEAIFEGSRRAENLSLPPPNWTDVGADDQWARADLGKILVDLS